MKKIIHFDLDYFFAQVELLDRPDLRNKPVAIGGPSLRKGVLSTCNYVARKYGLHSAMPTFKAFELCPDLVILKSNFSKYREYSQKVFEVFYKYSKKVQVVSVDEAYIDVTEYCSQGILAIDVAKEMKEEIYTITGLTGSAGVSYNKMLAKIASEINKPNGLCVISPEVFNKYGHEIKVSKINGVGKVMKEKLSSLGIETFGDLQKFSKLDLINLFGKFGAVLFDYCRGIDNREVRIDRVRKSLSVERTFYTNIMNEQKLRSELTNCFDEFNRRFEKYKEFKIKSSFVKIKYSDFTQTTIECSADEINEKSFQVLFGRRFAERADPVRLLGLGVRFQIENENKDQLTLI